MSLFFARSHLWCLVLGGVLSFPTMAQLDMEVTFDTNETEYTLSYDEPVRLERILRDVNEQILLPLSQASHSLPPVYWLGSQLIDVQQNQEWLTQKKTIIAELIAVSQDYPQFSNTFNELVSALNAQPHGCRQFIPLDLDTVVSDYAYSPKLSGEFALRLSDVPKNVYLVGAVEQQGTQTWQPRNNAQAYVQAALPLSISDKSWVFVIQPDGHIENHPIAVWNQKHHDIAPGSIVFVGFKPFFGDLNILNQGIATLLSHQGL